MHAVRLVGAVKAAVGYGLALVMLALVAPVTASAQSSYPGQRPAPYKVVFLVNEWARPFWYDRNVRACDGHIITVWVVDNLTQEDGLAWGRGGTCELWLQADLVAMLDKKMSRHATRTDLKWRRIDLIDECTAVFHETGHALGLQHTATGLMAGRGAVPPYYQAWAPYECRLWARAQVPFT